MAGRPQGYDYSYGFWIDDELIPLYDERIRSLKYREARLKFYLFEIRTNFKLKRRDHVAAADDDDDDGEMMGSETFGDVDLRLRDKQQELSCLVAYMGCRMKDYWMSDDEIQSFVRDLLDFAANQSAAAYRYEIPVVVELDVWTVQQEGEPINETIDRAIRPECLFPLHLCAIHHPRPRDEDKYGAHVARHKEFLVCLRRIRMEDEAGLALMAACPVCSRNSTIGDQLSSLPCGHACHSLCVVRWLQKGNSTCPSCAFQIPTEPVRRRD